MFGDYSEHQQIGDRPPTSHLIRSPVENQTATPYPANCREIPPFPAKDFKLYHYLRINQLVSSGRMLTVETAGSNPQLNGKGHVVTANVSAGPETTHAIAECPFPLFVHCGLPESARRSYV
jgi:hypothetical protein